MRFRKGVKSPDSPEQLERWIKREAKRQLEVIKPDGVDIYIPIKEFVSGSSVFIPCIDTKKARNQINSYAKRHKITVKMATEQSKGMHGLRVWRIS